MSSVNCSVSCDKPRFDSAYTGVTQTQMKCCPSRIMYAEVDVS